MCGFKSPEAPKIPNWLKKKKKEKSIIHILNEHPSMYTHSRQSGCANTLSIAATVKI